MLDKTDSVWDNLYREHGSIDVACSVIDVRYIYSSDGSVEVRFTIDSPIRSQGIDYDEFWLSKFKTASKAKSRVGPYLVEGDNITIHICGDPSRRTIAVHDRVSDEMTTCPMCSSPLIPDTNVNGVVGRCVSKSCPGTMSTGVYHFVSTMGMLQSKASRWILNILLTRGVMLNPVQLFYLQYSDVSGHDIPVKDTVEFFNEVHSIRGGKLDADCSLVLRSLGIPGLTPTYYAAIHAYFHSHNLGLKDMLKLIDEDTFHSIYMWYDRHTTSSTNHIQDDYHSDLHYWREYLSHPANKDTFVHLVNILMT